MEANPYRPAQTQFNAAALTVMRLHGLIHAANMASISDQYPLWLRSLEALYREVACKLNEPEQQDLDAVWTNANQAVSNLMVDQQRGDTNDRTRNDLVAQCYSNLDSLHKLLMRRMDEHGMLMVNKDDPGLSFRGDL